MREKNPVRRLLALTLTAVLFLSACGTPDNTVDPDTQSNTVLTWSSWSGYDAFLALAAEKYPDITIELTPYAGYNRTGYSWAQMRADDIPDIFITSHPLDNELIKARLVDLSAYDFINDFSTGLLDQLSIDGGVYMLPVNNTICGIYYNKTWMEERDWKVPTNFEELEAICLAVQEEGAQAGIADARLTGGPFSSVFDLAKTDWLTTPEGVTWERDFLAGNATAAGRWEGTMEYVQKYIDLGMFKVDPENRRVNILIDEYLGERKAMFCVSDYGVASTKLGESDDEIGMMPLISEDGSKNVYIYNPSSYIGISSKLTQPGNEKKLEDAIKLISFMFSPEGQDAFISESTPCVLSALEGHDVGEDALIYDAQQALREGRAFPMTYAHWENIMIDVGQSFKDWFMGVNDMNGPACIALMDRVQQSYLNQQEEIYFCESTENFTLEETARLVGKGLGSFADTDAAIIPYTDIHRDDIRLSCGVTGKLYKDRINSEITNSICPGTDGEYAVLTMTGAEAKALVEQGFDMAGDGNPYPYLMVTKGDIELEDEQTYQIAFIITGYTEDVGVSYNAQVEKGSLCNIMREYLTEQKTVSPDGNPWE